MSMFSEISAGIQATKLETILFRAIHTTNDDIIEFATKYIYPLYQDQCCEAWENENKEIENFFQKELDKLRKV